MASAEVRFPPMRRLALEPDEGQVLDWALHFHYARHGDAINEEIPRIREFADVLHHKVQEDKGFTLIWPKGEKTVSLGHLATMVTEISHLLSAAQQLKINIGIETDFDPEYWDTTCKGLAGRLIEAEFENVLTTQGHNNGISGYES